MKNYIFYTQNEATNKLKTLADNYHLFGSDIINSKDKLVKQFHLMTYDSILTKTISNVFNFYEYFT